MSFEQKKWDEYKDADKLYKKLSDDIVDELTYYIFLDEIQLVDGFEEVINSIKAEYNTDIYVTGSNSKHLSHDINTIFRGRGIEIKLYPFSFSEYLTYRQIDRQLAFSEYLKYGGMPYVVFEDDERYKKEYLDMIANTVVTRDVIDRYAIKNETLFKAVIDFLCSSIGSLVSSSKIANSLKSNGFKHVDNETISRYLSYVCDSYLFYKAERYDIKGKEYLKTLNKYYAADLGLRNALINYRQIEITHMIEDIVYIELLRRGYIVDIGKNREKEIDFIAKELGGKKYYIQVSYSILDEATKNRELSAFSLLDDGFKKILITMDYTPLTTLENGYIMINLLDFLLNDRALEEA